MEWVFSAQRELFWVYLDHFGKKKVTTLGKESLGQKEEGYLLVPHHSFERNIPAMSVTWHVSAIALFLLQLPRAVAPGGC